MSNADHEICVDGQADSLTSVVDTPFGKVGALNCWEHIQPLLRYYEYSQGVEIHVAGWPAFWDKAKTTPVRQFLEVNPSKILSYLTEVKPLGSVPCLDYPLQKGNTDPTMR